MTRHFLARSKFLALVVAFACVVVAAVALKISDPPGDFDDHRGVIGTPVDINGGELIVEKVRVGTAISERGERKTETDGMFVVITVTVRAPREKVLLTGSELVSGSRVYGTFGLNNISAVSGFETQGEFIYEVDPRRVDDLALRMWRTELVSGMRQRAVVHLGITPENADEWRASAVQRPIEMSLGQDSRPIA